MRKNIPIDVFDEYVLRAPVLSLTEIMNIDENQLLNFFKDNSFLDAIFLASPELYEEALKKSNLLDADNRNVLYTLLKYLIRMGSRSTPFGLFSGISVGHIAKNKTSICLNEKKSHKSYSRLDMDFLFSFSSAIEQSDLEIRKHLKYFPNNSMYSMGEFEQRYVEVSQKGINKKHLLSSFIRNEYIDEILSNSNTGATINQLVEIITNKGIDAVEAENFINELIDNQILISSIYPTITGESYLKLLCKNIPLEKIQSFSTEVSQLLKKLDNNSIKDSKILLLKMIHKTIENYTNYPVNIKHLVQTDLLIKTKSNYINDDIKKNIKKAVRVLNILSLPKINEDLKEFKKRFYDRYEEQAIPLTLALDVETGIGYGVKSTFYDDSSDLTKDVFLADKTDGSKKLRKTIVDNILYNKFIECIAKNEIEIELFENDLDKLSENWEDLPNTFSLQVKIVEKKEEALKLYISNCGGTTATYIFSRFISMDDKLKDLANKIVQYDKQVGKIDAEIVHLPENRVGNILYRPILREYEIPYLANSTLEKHFQINIEDLFLTLRDNRLILFSKKLGKEVVPYLSNAHNYWTNSLPIYNFLCDLRSQDVRDNLTFSWGEYFQGYKFLPRISYDGIIISLAQWALTKSDIKKIHDKESFKKLKAKMKIPNLFVIIEGDQELLINSESDLILEMFLSHIRNKSRILIKEFLFDSKNSLVSSDRGIHVNEIFFSIYKLHHVPNK